MLNESIYEIVGVLPEEKEDCVLNKHSQYAEEGEVLLDSVFE